MEEFCTKSLARNKIYYSKLCFKAENSEELRTMQKDKKRVEKKNLVKKLHLRNTSEEKHTERKIFSVSA